MAYTAAPALLPADLGFSGKDETTDSQSHQSKPKAKTSTQKTKKGKASVPRKGSKTRPLIAKKKKTVKKTKPLPWSRVV